MVAHHCSTVTHPRTDWTIMTHPQTDRTTMSLHPLTTTTVTRSDHLYLNGDFRSHCQSCHCCLSLAIATSTLSSSLSLSLSLMIKWWVCGIEIFVLRFVSLGLYIGIFIIIFAWKMGKCEKWVENVFSRAFSRTQENIWKYFPKHFLECNQTPKNIFFSQKYFQLKLFYSRKIFYIEPNTILDYSIERK